MNHPSIIFFFPLPSFFFSAKVDTNFCRIVMPNTPPKTSRHAHKTTSRQNIFILKQGAHRVAAIGVTTFVR